MPSGERAAARGASVLQEEDILEGSLKDPAASAVAKGKESTPPF
jgi:hypothetical protein